jgi:hypothetical protein
MSIRVTLGRFAAKPDTLHQFVYSFRCLIVSFLFLAVIFRPATAHASPPSVTIRQLHDVVQGGSGWFEITIDSEEKRLPVTLRLNRVAGTGAAIFDGGSLEILLTKSRDVQIHGLIGSEFPGALTLSAWLEGDSTPSASFFFDVLAANPEPRIFFDGHDVTNTVQEVIVGQQIQLNVILHPSLSIRSQSWYIGNPGDYSGGFLHTPLQGGPQPVILEGSTTRFHWLAPAKGRTVTYRLTLADGTIASAFVKFDVDGPSSVQVEIAPVQVVVAPGAVPNSSVLGLSGSGITFRAFYFLPEEMRRNFTWVQLIQFDNLQVKTHDGPLNCIPKSFPVSQLGTGLDTSYPYDTRNPTRDNPPLQLTPDAQEFSCTFSGLPGCLIQLPCRLAMSTGISLLTPF